MGRTATARRGPAVSWAELFERAAVFEATEADVRASLARRRGEERE